jgi:hypothetical protein
MGLSEIRDILAAMTIPSVTLLGCITAHVYSEYKGFKSAQKFLKQFFPKRRDSFYIRLEFILSALVGTCIGIILYSPATPYQALAAGIGWTAAFNLLKADRVPEEDTSPVTEEAKSGSASDLEA